MLENGQSMTATADQLVDAMQRAYRYTSKASDALEIPYYRRRRRLEVSYKVLFDLCYITLTIIAVIVRQQPPFPKNQSVERKTSSCRYSM